MGEMIVLLYHICKNKDIKMSRINSENTINGLLWHYTGLDTLEAIVRSKKIRATHYTYLNDESEITIGCNIVLERLKRKKVDPKAIETVQSTLSSFQKKTSKLMFYITSFSENGDSLYQWVAYTDHEKGGCAIGIAFDTNLFKEQSLSPTFGKCIYSKAAFIRKIDPMIEDLRDGKCAALTANNFLGLIPLLKHPCFKPELEWRYVWHALECDDSRSLLRSDTQITTISDAVMPRPRTDKKDRFFIERDFNDLNSIKKIILSPHGPDFVSKKEKIDKLMRELGLGKVEVIQSKLPYVGDVVKSHNAEITGNRI